MFQPVRDHLNILICFKSYTGLFQKVEVVLKLIFLLKGFPIPRRKVKHTPSSTVHLKLFLTVHLGGKKTDQDRYCFSLSVSLRNSSEYQTGPLLPYEFFIISNSPSLCQWCGDCTRGKASVDMCNLCFQKDAGI